MLSPALTLSAQTIPMTTREKSPAPRNTPTFTHDGPQQQQHAASAQTPTVQASTSEGLSPFVTVLVTPKLNFSLPRQPQWRTPEDIGQEEVRAAPARCGRHPRLAA